MNDSRSSSVSSVHWRLASVSRTTHWVAVANEEQGQAIASAGSVPDGITAQ
jgi:hypothetical protein